MKQRCSPPPFAERLLSAVLPVHDRDAIVGDLAEEFDHYVSRIGETNARRWYRRQVLRSILPAFHRRFAQARAALQPKPGIRHGEPITVDNLRQDVRYAFRTFRRKPTFVLLVLLTAALGVGSTAAVFTVVYEVLYRPLPYPDGHRLYTLWERTRTGGYSWVSAPNFQDWQDQLTSFSGIAAYTPEGFNVAAGGMPERIRAQAVTPNFFDVLNAPFALGSGLHATDNPATASAVVVISYGLWQRQFAGRSDVLGRSLLLENQAHEIVGVLGSGVDFPSGVDLWFPVDLSSAGWKRQRGTSWLMVIGRLAPSFDVDGAREELTALGTRLAHAYPDTNRGESITANALLDELVGDARMPLVILAGAVTITMLVVCVNIAALFLARATDRHRELAVRRSLGASERRLVSQLLTESLVMAAVGGVLGVGVALAELGLLKALAPPDLPRTPDTGLTIAMLGFAGLAAIAVGILSGVIPALRQARVAPRSVLTHASASGASMATRRLLVTAQVSLAVVLAVAGGHLLLSLANYRAVDTGLEPNGVLSGGLPLDESRYPTDERVASFYATLVERVRALPDVQEAGVVSVLPFSGNVVTFSFGLRDPRGFESDQLRARYQSASAGYFRAMGIPLVRGRSFRETEGPADEPVVIIDQAFAERFFTDRDPLGQEIYAVGDVWRRVVGIVGTVSGTDLGRPPDPMFYVPLHQDPRDAMTLVVRSGPGNAISLSHPVRQVIRSLDPNQPFVSPVSMTELIGRVMAAPRFTATVVVFFGMVTLFLAALGIYGLLAHVVSTRTREIAIRIALGATAHKVRWIVLRHGMASSIVGLIVGMAAAFPVIRLVRSALFDVAPFEPTITAAVAVLLIAVAGTASYVPARRAIRLAPAQTLRE